MARLNNSHSSTLRACQAALLALSLFIPFPTRAYDMPLTESCIRDAYFLGTRTGGLNSDFIAQYARQLPELKQGGCTSDLRIETPFLRVAEHAHEVPNYSAQDAVKEFYGKPMVFRMHLAICYELHAPANAVKVKVIQHKKELVPLSFESTPYSEATDFGFLPPNGEQIDLEFPSGKIDSSTVTVLIDTPNAQHVEATFDLQTVR